MGTIQNKRASGRGAPPGVYLQFTSIDDAEVGAEIAKVGKEILWLMLVGLVIGFVLLILSAFGANPFDYIEDTDSW